MLPKVNLFADLLPTKSVEIFHVPDLLRFVEEKTAIKFAFGNKSGKIFLVPDLLHFHAHKSLRMKRVLRKMRQSIK